MTFVAGVQTDVFSATARRRPWAMYWLLISIALASLVVSGEAWGKSPLKQYDFTAVAPYYDEAARAEWARDVATAKQWMIRQYNRPSTELLKDARAALRTVGYWLLHLLGALVLLAFLYGAAKEIGRNVQRPGSLSGGAGQTTQACRQRRKGGPIGGSRVIEAILLDKHNDNPMAIWAARRARDHFFRL